MADDDIERLLREVDAMNSGGKASSPASRSSQEVVPAKTSGSGSSIGETARTSLIAGAVTGVGTLVVGWFIPFIGGVQFGLGGFVGGTAAFFAARRFGR